ncbi:MAG TPA: hypothetical protein VF266_26415, partial [Thermoanaerobaculia bacterium]
MRSLFLALLFATSAHAGGWWVDASPKSLRVEVGSTETVRIYARWSGLTVYYPWSPWRVFSTRPSIAAANAEVPSPSTYVYVTVAGIAPGKASLYVDGTAVSGQYVDIDVVCGEEAPVVNATPVTATRAGVPVTLRVESRMTGRTTFTWYRGRLGDTSSPITNAGPSLEFTPNGPGAHSVWVMATTTCSSSTAEFV